MRRKGPKKYKKQDKKEYKYSTETPVDLIKTEYSEDKGNADLEAKLEELVRKQQKLQAIKTLAVNTSYGIMDGKEAIEQYIETGNWDHINWDDANVEFSLLDSVFTKIFSEKPSDWVKNRTKQEHRQKVMLRRIHEDQYPASLVLSESLSLAKMYGTAVLNKHKDDVWNYIKENYILIER